MANDHYLMHFPGPRGENGASLSGLLETIVADHLHWRRNYFPDDPRLEPGNDPATTTELTEAVEQLIAKLRRSFPFHNPRYIAHQQSELSIPALAGVLAGVLYNANNVTSESGNVTVELEIEATSCLLRMIGYTPPPDPVSLDATKTELEKYLDGLRENPHFAWCHLTSGGTIANAEGLWMARNVTYQALAVAQVCTKQKLALPVTTAQGATVDIADLGEHELLNLPPRQAVTLVADLLAAGVDRGQDSSVVWAWLQESRALHPLPELLAQHQLNVFVTGARHYSISKAMDVLGMGTGAIVDISTDSRHRLDITELEMRIRQQSGEGKIPLAVVAIIGTTEEGAVDPLHKIVDLRENLQTEGISFWIHADAAWGGYLATLHHMPPRERCRMKARALHTRLLDDEKARALGVQLLDDDEGSSAKQGGPRGLVDFAAPGQILDDRWLFDYVGCRCGPGSLSDDVISRLDEVRQALREDGKELDDRFDELVRILGDKPVERSEAYELDQEGEFLHDTFTMEVSAPTGKDRYRRPVVLEKVDPEVQLAIRALPAADSVTVDPHKMGYQPYACGAIAFRDDRCRYFVRQQAPYITSGGNTFTHQPLRRVEVSNGVPKAVTDSPAVYTMEGSRPSSQATGLWLSTSVLPLDQENHGELVRVSWRAARRLYAWLEGWEPIERELFDAAPLFRFVLLTRHDRGRPAPPDTNLVIFGVAPTRLNTLAAFNELTDRVYDRFTISAEQGDRSHSYGQPFFLSRTTFQQKEYPQVGIAPLAAAAGITDFATEYPKPKGKMLVLRATIMNPYLLPMTARAHNKDVLRDFMVEMAHVAREAALNQLKVSKQQGSGEN